MKKLGRSFYGRHNVLEIARDLIGKTLVTRFNNKLTSGLIVETEAYAGVNDRASHAFGARRTARTETMYGKPGAAYVYLCYGIHHLFNIVTNKQDIPHAILIRSVEPVAGIEIMLQRTGKPKADFTLTRGPGNVSKALGIFTRHSGMDLLGNEMYVLENGYVPADNEIVATPRIGVDYAGEDALLCYRFILKNNKYVSGKR